MLLIWMNISLLMASNYQFLKVNNPIIFHQELCAKNTMYLHPCFFLYLHYSIRTIKD